jgi:hypothetical protein
LFELPPEVSSLSQRGAGGAEMAVKRIDQSFGIVGGGDEIVHDAPSQQG